MRQVIGPALAALALHFALVVAYVAGFDGDLGALACAARERLGTPPYEAIHTGFQSGGYDSQFYFALAQDPWRRHGLYIDIPAARQLRILYPALSWLLSGGEPFRLLWVMPLVNLLAIAAMAGLAAWLAHCHGLNPWWGVLLPLAVNAGMPLLRNLTDVLSTLFVLVMLSAWLLRWPACTLALAALAALLSREQNLIIVCLTLGAVALSQPPHAEAEERARRRHTLAGLLAALALWAGWLGLLRYTYGQWPFLSTQGNFAPPLHGFIARWAHLLDGTTSAALAHLMCLLLLLGQLGLTVIFLVKGPRERLPLLVALAGVALMVMGGWALYGDKWSYTRVFAWLPLGLWVASVQVRWRWPLAALSLPLLLPLAVVFRVWFPDL